jgi:hypothetical protein
MTPLPARTRVCHGFRMCAPVNWNYAELQTRTGSTSRTEKDTNLQQALCLNAQFATHLARRR